MSSAPLQPSIIGGVRGFIWRILNFPVRIFLPSEIVFNRKLREFIGELMASMYAINAFTQKMEASIALLDHKMEILVKANQEMKEENLKLKSRLESLENLKLDGRLESLENLGLDGRLNPWKISSWTEG